MKQRSGQNATGLAASSHGQSLGLSVQMSDDVGTTQRSSFAVYLRTFMLFLIGREQLEACWQPAPILYHQDTVFDTTVWTWGTDVILTVVLWWLTYETWQAPLQSRLRIDAVVLTFLFGWSTFVGAFCHFWRGYRLCLNSMKFRCAWWLCVSSVAAVNGVLGLIGTDTFKHAAPQIASEYQNLLGVIDCFFIMFGVYLMIQSARGVFRCVFPASDIFFVGVCQSLGSLYICCILIGCYFVPFLNAQSFSTDQLERISAESRWALLFGFGLLGNMPLLWTYPRLVLGGYSRPVINCYLHFNLLVAWGCQGYALRQLLNA